MTLFPFRRPRRGLAISESALWYVETAHRWGTARLARVVKHALPPGLVCLSPTAANFTDASVAIDLLKSLTRASTRPRSVALTLPDVSSRSAVFEFASFPSSKAEQEALLRWRFEQDFHVPSHEGRLGFHVYRPRAGSHAREQAQVPIRVLAVLIHNVVVEQYEHICLEAGLIPMVVGLAGFEVLDACHCGIEAKRKQRAVRDGQVCDERVYLYLGEWGFTCLVLHDGIPVFVRIKRIPAIAQLGRQESSALEMGPALQEEVGCEMERHQSDPEPQDDHGQDAVRMKEEIVRTVTDEFVATLQYYFEIRPDPDRNGKELAVYAVEGIEGGNSFLQSSEQIQRLVEASVHDAPILKMTIITRDLLGRTLRTPSFPLSLHESALPAFASAVRR